MNKLDLECLKYVEIDTLQNIENNYKKIVGVEYNSDLINENKKNIGRVIAFSNCNNKVSLNAIIEFRSDKIKWVSNKTHENNKLILIDPYWVKSYLPNPKLEIPVKKFDVKTNLIVTEISNLTYSQFIKKELMFFYGKWEHRLVAAYDNFYYLMKNNQYYYAINATVKNYFVTQEELQHAITLVNNEKKRIKARWNRTLSIYHEANEAAKTINKHFGKTKTEGKVVQFDRQNSLNP